MKKVVKYLACGCIENVSTFYFKGRFEKDLWQSGDETVKFETSNPGYCFKRNNKYSNDKCIILKRERIFSKKIWYKNKKQLKLSQHFDF